ncbi:ADL194Wp [Eremothecium gossypii ATCC 10895]|uniref:tRNA wybutosine-synthesizing protein 4 n=1 Tax=Eremothecium gossypii (strain ATCC 10895 / CBS 109.51 / FGSC 9923 / NRRL Y-1056) TaxID=284811 RepID=TYW4_EREGS|nr:ADL194Wp [Eremothecium gossypii ATCC 10895]Q75AW4.1 RecName: Full=tRNA wybutosine-synthesizing protein 4; Short=tRNA-yW synthesizing protein 4; AltName: Full=Leucine carboxyl methyltransferase 2; AltName: Full=tRNA(Phe) (7-(3-amino-3-(methoxycarbonyl)propyl)wyosine(37)-N)-methoxycarbonyltransferase; AltName: Full=tRNA(Phe) (7-(3-amino-3-carboxypropyl)wyosine(37)-O)-methyltransferase [Eremothecium gossypii ATCC 10895]AAS51726.1 ADL194Wp [Eremothecium gossypii ATCC 10895]
MSSMPVHIERPAELTAKQRLQLEKKVRSMKYADLAVQGTNTSSIASKRSVERLYADVLGTKVQGSNGQPREYFKYFVSKPLRRSPCINRGYWLRLMAIRTSLRCIAEGTGQRDILVVNLGCGYDPLPFQLLDHTDDAQSEFDDRMSFVDVDYPDLIAKKLEIVKNTPELQHILGGAAGDAAGPVVYRTAKYMAAACDLNDSAAFGALTESFHPRSDEVVVFIAEVSLAYMRPERADAIIEACGRIPNSHFILLEQLLPAGEHSPFSRTMLSHFKSNDSPLQSVSSYPTISEQEVRFKRLGFKNVNAGDMHQLWRSLDKELVSKVQAVEPFDELEEFYLFCHHYIIAHATNDLSFRFGPKYAFPQVPQSPSKSCSSNSPMELVTAVDTDLLQRKFGASVVVDSDTILFSFGCLHNKLENILVMGDHDGAFKISKGPAPPARMCHTFTKLDDRTIFLVGGRQSPTKPLGDAWLLKLRDGEWHWEMCAPLMYPRFRHNCVNVGKGKALIYGGETDGATFLIYDCESNTYYEPVYPRTFPRKVSAAMCYDFQSNRGYILGGALDNMEVDDTLCTFAFDARTNSIEILETSSHPLYQRYGAKSVVREAGHMLIVGGVSPHMLFNDTTSIIEVELTTNKVNCLQIPSSLWKNHAQLLVGFELQIMSDGTVLIFGGGAVCYGFGAAWNGILRLGRETIAAIPLRIL